MAALARGQSWLRISSTDGVHQACRRAREVGATVGFDRDQVEELVLATSELATNLVRYARAGRLSLRLVDGERGRGIALESKDTGPGLGQVGDALTNGVSTGGGLGAGFSTICGNVDSVQIDSSPAGTHIVGYKWLTRRS